MAGDTHTQFVIYIFGFFPFFFSLSLNEPSLLDSVPHEHTKKRRREKKKYQKWWGQNSLGEGMNRKKIRRDLSEENGRATHTKYTSRGQLDYRWPESFR